MADKFPTKILGWIQNMNGDSEVNPNYNLIFYTQNELNNFLNYAHKEPLVRIEEHKPKLKELKRFNLFQKLSYALPFKTQINDIIVDIIKLGIGFVFGYFTKQVML